MASAQSAGLSATVEGDDTALAGPTGMPWVNSNGWFVQLARVRSNDKTIWLDFDDKERAAVHKTGAYLLALADTGVYGGDWIISLDDNFRSDLANQNPEALDRWRRISATLDFFKQHSDWRSFRSKSILAVISDFSGGNQWISEEVLNLLSRRHLPFRIIEKAKGETASLVDCKAILYVDKDAPSKSLHEKLLEFVSKGGLLMASPSWGKSKAALVPGPPTTIIGFAIMGRGVLQWPRKSFKIPLWLLNRLIC